MTSPQKILAEVYGKLDEAIDGLNKWQRLYKDLQYKYNELASQSFEQKALAHPEQEPIGWMTPSGEGFRFRFEPPTNDVPLGWTPIYTAPPKRDWKGLTSDDKHFLLANAWNKEQAFDGFMEAIDKFLEEKNT
jgi:hypothetical protein